MSAVCPFRSFQATPATLNPRYRHAGRRFGFGMVDSGRPYKPEATSSLGGDLYAPRL